MNQIIRIFIPLLLSMAVQSTAYAGDSSPWGGSRPADWKYGPSRVVYDLSSGRKGDIDGLLDRISYLNNLYGSDPFESSVVVVIHGQAVPFFAIDMFDKYKDMITRAQSLTVGTPIEFRMCQVAARLMKYEPKDIHGFVKMIPMADAELVRLQQEGYAYMQ